jgi:ribosomal protein S18 acetylase RimI-like enzyme
MIKYEELDIKDINQYDSITSSYSTTKKYEIKKINRGLGGFEINLVSVPLYEKTFDGNSKKWLEYFDDLSNWKIYVAKDNDKLIGGCVVASKTKECNMLEGRDDLAVLWDIRVSEGYKHQGIGQHLFDMAINYCKENNFKQLKIECQNTNTAAVNFYHKQGAKLCAINEYAYSDYPNETQLLWYIDL